MSTWLSDLIKAGKLQFDGMSSFGYDRYNVLYNVSNIYSIDYADFEIHKKIDRINLAFSSSYHRSTIFWLIYR